MSVDNRLVEYWRRQLAGRRRLKAAPPIRPPGGPGQEHDPGASEAGADPSAGEASSNVVPMAFEDR